MAMVGQYRSNNNNNNNNNNKNQSQLFWTVFFNQMKQNP
jgi:hypothetical protein